MTGYSTEQAATLAIILGFLLKLFNIEIATEELTTVVSALLVVGGAVWNWYKRYQRGGVNALGFRIE